MKADVLQYRIILYITTIYSGHKCKINQYMKTLYIATICSGHKCKTNQYMKADVQFMIIQYSNHLFRAQM